jgi:hypothetical protein
MRSRRAPTGRPRLTEGELLYVPRNTKDYVLIGPRHPSDGPARGPAITTLPAAALLAAMLPAWIFFDRSLSIPRDPPDVEV